MIFDPIYWLFLLPGIALALYAQWRVTSAYRKYSQVANQRGMTGAEVARILMRAEGLTHVNVEQIPGDLTDHYDPRSKTMRLSAGSSQRPSVAAMAIVAHELGHAAQDREGYMWLQMRTGIAGIASISSNFSWLLIFGGLMLGALGGSELGWNVAFAGVVLMSAAVVFALVTLPVEFNASSRAREMLMRAGIVNAQEAQGVNAMLNAAALTYVAAAAQAVLQLAYWAMVLSGARRN